MISSKRNTDSLYRFEQKPSENGSIQNSES